MKEERRKRVTVFFFLRTEEECEDNGLVLRAEAGHRSGAAGG